MGEGQALAQRGWQVYAKHHRGDRVDKYKENGGKNAQRRREKSGEAVIHKVGGRRAADRQTDGGGGICAGSAGHFCARKAG